VRSERTPDVPAGDGHEGSADRRAPDAMTGGVLPSELAHDPHRRYDPLNDEWVLVSAGRTLRPWLGAEEPEVTHERPSYLPDCYLCPGNVRANGGRNPSYASTFVFDNDFAALRTDTSELAVEDGLLRAEGEHGVCRVVCFSPRHDLTLGAMPPADIREVIDVWADQTSELGADFRWVQVFENRGAAMGASNPHPHGQIWAGTALPGAARREGASQARHAASTGRRLLLDYVTQESGGPRTVVESDEWLVVVPFWASWPFETLVIPKRPAARLPDLDDAARDGLGASLVELLGRYDGLFRRPFPYSMGWHQAPFGGSDDTDGWQVHAHFYPPLLRANIRKFMVGYELLAETQRDLTPEDAAERLRAVSLTRTPVEPPAPTTAGAPVTPARAAPA
jgi:UDPglucose--hexose-1-phosphate uridylyltransferase